MDDIQIHRLNPGRDWRYEIKLTCAREMLVQARSWIYAHPEGFRATFLPRFVNNIYLDTLDLSLFDNP